MNFHIHQAIEILSRTPSVLRSMLDGLSDPWVHNNYGDKTFSPFDVVGHLILGERTDWMERVQMILDHGESKSFVPFERYKMYEENKGEALVELLNTFEALRKENIVKLKSFELTPDQLALLGAHPDLGQVTLEQLLATWVAHDLNHIHQIAKCMAWQYKNTIGPWLPYLGVLK